MIGNVPLAVLLWKGGMSFGGVTAFMYADLLILPILNTYRKYYGSYQKYWAPVWPPFSWSPSSPRWWRRLRRRVRLRRPGTDPQPGRRQDSRGRDHLERTTWLDIAFLLPDLWAQVARLAPLIGPTPVLESKQPLYRFERDKARCGRAHADGLRRRTAASGGQAPSKWRPGRSRSHQQEGRFFSVGTEVIRVHADERIVVPGTYHLDPVL